MELPISYEEKGKEIGKEIGRREGIDEGVKRVAVEMLKKGFDIKLISEVTHLDLEEIKKLKNQL